MAREDHVDAVHRLGQLVVLPFSVLRARVGQADDKIGVSLRLDLGHDPLRRRGDGLEFHAGHGSAFVGVHPQHAEHRDAHGLCRPLPGLPLLFDDHVVGDAIGVPGSPGIRIALRRLVIGLDQGGQRLSAGHGGPEHVGQPGGPVVKLMVAQGGRVIAHGPQCPELRRVGGVDGLEQRAHGKIPGVQGDGGTLDGRAVGQHRGPFPLLLQQRGQAGVAAVFPAPLSGHGQKVIVGVMGKQDGQGLAGRVGGRGQGQAAQQQDRTPQQRSHASNGLHIPSLPSPSVTGIISAFPRR